MARSRDNEEPLQFRTEARVLVDGYLSYCLVQTLQHYQALTAEYATTGSGSVSSTPSSSGVSLLLLEEHPLTQRYCFYAPFHLDFGPFMWTQATRLWHALNSQLFASGKMLLVVVRLYESIELATDLVALLGVVAVLSGSLRSAEHLPLFFPEDGVLSRLVPFHDASPHDDLESYFDLTVRDVILATLRAERLWGNLLRDTERFTVASEHFQQIEHGDVCWVVPWRLAAFPSPHLGDHDREPHKSTHPVGFYGQMFADPRGFFGCVESILQLNDNVEYRTEGLRRRCIDHQTLFYPDGATPTAAIMAKFFALYDAIPTEGTEQRRREGLRGGAMALHCMAGLGRTGTLLSLALMRDYQFTAREAIAWCRLCRPGCVIGPQQQFLCWVEVQWRRLVVAPSTPSYNRHDDEGDAHGRPYSRERSVSSQLISQPNAHEHETVSRSTTPQLEEVIINPSPTAKRFSQTMKQPTTTPLLNSKIDIRPATAQPARHSQPSRSSTKSSSSPQQLPQQFTVYHVQSSAQPPRRSSVIPASNGSIPLIVSAVQERLSHSANRRDATPPASNGPIRIHLEL